MNGGCTALILAGSRGTADPVALACGVTHKAFAPVAGVPMLLRVVEALSEADCVRRIVVCIEDPALLDGVPALCERRATGSLEAVASAASPSRSVRRVLETLADPLPLLVTTADHALLTPAMVDHFWRSLPAGAAIAAGVASEATIRAGHPETRRTYIRFRDAAVSGCNLFALTAPEAERVVALWTVVERQRKRPWRLVRLLGPLTVARFLLGRLSLGAALDDLSHRAGARVGVVDLPFAEAAIDVDSPADLALVEGILRRRADRAA